MIKVQNGSILVDPLNIFWHYSLNLEKKNIFIDSHDNRRSVCNRLFLTLSPILNHCSFPDDIIITGYRFKANSIL